MRTDTMQMTATDLIGQHTPGPWKLDDARSSLVYLINNDRGGAVGELVYADFRRPADALLIAAAPELLAAARAALALLRDPDAEAFDADLIELQLAAAIARAEGLREVDHAA
jgi:hypothetical protein